MKVHVNLEIRIGIKSLNIQLNSFCKIKNMQKSLYVSEHSPYLCSFPSSIKYLVILKSQ